MWGIQGWEPDSSRFSFSRRNSSGFFVDLRKGFPVYLDPKNQNTFVFSRDSGGHSRSSVCLNLESVQHSLERHLRRRDASHGDDMWLGLHPHCSACRYSWASWRLRAGSACRFTHHFEPPSRWSLSSCHQSCQHELRASRITPTFPTMTNGATRPISSM